jgi:hypothetical protein
MRYLTTFLPGSWAGEPTEARLTVEDTGFFADGARVLLYLAMEDGELHDAEFDVILDYAQRRLQAAGRAGSVSRSTLARWIENYVPTRRAAKLALGRLMAQPSHGAEIAHRIIDVVVADGAATDAEMKAAWALVEAMEKRERTLR